MVSLDGSTSISVLVVNDASGHVLTRVRNAPLVLLDQGVELRACSVSRTFATHYSGQAVVLVEQARIVDGEAVGRESVQVSQHHPNFDWLPVFLLEQDVADVFIVSDCRLEFTDAVSGEMEVVGVIRDLVDRSMIVLDLDMTSMMWVVGGRRLPVPVIGSTVITGPVSFGSKGDKGAADCKVCE